MFIKEFVMFAANESLNKYFGLESEGNWSIAQRF